MGDDESNAHKAGECFYLITLTSMLTFNAGPDNERLFDMTMDELEEHQEHLIRDAGDVSAELSQALHADSSQHNYDLPMSDAEDEVLPLNNAISKKLSESTREFLNDVESRPLDVVEKMARQELAAAEDEDEDEDGEEDTQKEGKDGGAGELVSLVLKNKC